MLMSPPPLHAPLAVFIAYIVTVSAVPAVSTVPSSTVRTSTSNHNIDGLENFKVTATIANTGGVLNPFPEDSFTITDPSGSRLPFTGGSVSRVSGSTTKSAHQRF